MFVFFVDFLYRRLERKEPDSQLLIPLAFLLDLRPVVALVILGQCYLTLHVKVPQFLEDIGQAVPYHLQFLFLQLWCHLLALIPVMIGGLAL